MSSLGRLDGATKTGNDYFSVFSIAPAFDLNLEELEARFYELQQQHHPDQQHRDLSAQQAEERQALESARLNEAYRALRTPVGRAQCLLRVAGIDPEENRSELNQEQLTEQFELRAELQEISTLQQLEAFRDKSRQCFQQIAEAFRAAWTQQDTGAATLHYQRLLFTDRLLSRISEREDELLDIL
ncbi:MAG: Fe-S protein assembly co-chaperone HscB [Gammaproteobacteria bacterium]